MKYKIGTIVYNELNEDFCALKYLAKKCKISYQAIWRYIKLMMALDILETKSSPLNPQIKLYKLKEISFDDFMRKMAI